MPTYRELQFKCPQCAKDMTLTLAEYLNRTFECPHCGATGSTAAKLQVPLPHCASQSPTLPDKVLTREFKGSYSCTATQQGSMKYKGFPITLGAHTHHFSFTVTIDWDGDSDELLFDDRSPPIGSLNLPIMSFMSAAQDMVQTRLIGDLRILPYLHRLRIHVCSLTTNVQYTWSDQYSIDNRYVPPCDQDRTAEPAAHGLLAVIHDLIANLTFGNVDERKAITSTFESPAQELRNVERHCTPEKASNDFHHVLECPACGQKLRFPAGKGQLRVHCPSCGHTLLHQS